MIVAQGSWRRLTAKEQPKQSLDFSLMPASKQPRTKDDDEDDLREALGRPLDAHLFGVEAIDQSGQQATTLPSISFLGRTGSAEFF